MLLFSLVHILQIFLILIIWSAIFTQTCCQLSNAPIPIRMDTVGNKKHRVTYLTNKVSKTVPFAVLLQLNTVMAIVYTEEGNRYRRLGNLHVAKRYYQKAIQLHRYVRQTLLHIQNTQ